MDSVCYVVTGLLDKNHIYSLVQSYINVPNKILSTWKDQNPEYISILHNIGFHIVLNEHPSHITSVNCQNTCVYNGSLRAKELGFSHIIRSRTDVWSKDFLKFATVTKPFYESKLSCLSSENSINYHGEKYFFDVIYSGPINDIIRLTKPLQIPEDLRYPEKFLQEEYSGKKNLSSEELKELFNYSIHEVRKHDIRIIWIPKKGTFELIYDLTSRPWFFT